MSIAHKRFCARPDDDVNAHGFDLFLQDMAGRLVYLTREQPSQTFHHGDLGAAPRDRTGDLQPEQATADADHIDRLRNSRQDGVCIF